MEPEETASVAAVREVIEEAGVRGKIDRCLGVFEVSLVPGSGNSILPSIFRPLNHVS